MQSDYRKYSGVGAYVFGEVGWRFREQGYLSAFDFFCIVIWKANRAKSKVAKRLQERAENGQTLDDVVRKLTAGIAAQPDAKARLGYLWRRDSWGFRLPTASAILTALYPEEFTVYDVRVCDQLRELLGSDFTPLNSKMNLDRLWEGYQEFRAAVRQTVPQAGTLRESDLYLWGKSFHDQLMADIESRFARGDTTDAEDADA